jgi:hypothetical protein
METFDVSEQEARDRAAGLVLLAEGWGSPEIAPHLEWEYLVKKDFGDKLRWRSEAERERFAREHQQNYDAYEAYIQRGKRA